MQDIVWRGVREMGQCGSRDRANIILERKVCEHDAAAKYLDNA